MMAPAAQGGMWTGSSRRDIDRRAASPESRGGLSVYRRPAWKVGRPRGYAVDEIQGLEEVGYGRVRTGFRRR